MRRLCGGLSWRQASLLPAYLGLALCLFWLVLSSPRACTAALKRHFDGVLLPILPSLNRSCCHLYFDLCIPWSIYACERGEWRRGGGWGGEVGRGRQRQLQCLLLYPGERLRYICLLKASATDKHSAAAERYKASSVAPKPPAPSHPSPPPESIGTVCMFCMLRQKRYSFNCALALWRGLNGAAHCCGNYKNQRRGKKRAGCYCCFRILRKQERSEQSRDFAHNMSGFHLPLPVSVTGGGKPLEGSGRTGTEEQTNLLRKEGGLQRLHSHKERVSRWDAEPVASPVFITSIKQISLGRTRHFRSASDFWHCSGI